jgi:hypothetical protein
MFAPCINSIKALFYTVDEGTAVPSSTVYRTLAHRLICRNDIDHVISDEHNRTIIVVLAKHEIAP